MRLRMIALVLATAGGALAWTSVVGEPRPLFGVTIPVVSTDWRVTVGLAAATLVLAAIALWPSARVHKRDEQLKTKQLLAGVRRERRLLNGG